MNAHFEIFARRHPELAGLLSAMERACELIVDSYRNKGKVLVCGNGGSCADADHIVGELMKSFLKKRHLSSELKMRFAELGGSELADRLQVPLRAVNLCSLPSLSTAFANDVEPDYVFAQQALAYTDPGDVFIGISTSGNARNVHHAALTAKALGAKLIGLTGANGGKMRAHGFYDVLVQAPGDVTHMIQEAHVAIYHAVCITVEKTLFDDGFSEEVVGCEKKL